ncbi:energy transducer TonB [Hymenobacter coccineus]|uniref:TonB C-terminal domain-containing protein n=1 Tax=Hymenobacter coccineus TaxID=1908235 RepID=A0A1G1THS8_9BACT|nr:energy transducer TonB [Hymenobacter coccineus]OGX90446.1 hypothetical protein BEN49_06595 [Hymenobacter coccineus]
MPQFPGLEPGDSTRSNNERIVKFINDGLGPARQLARDGSVQGRAFFSFAVDAQGHAVDIKLVQGIRADIDAEVLRNAHRLDSIQWRPGTQNGRGVRVSFTIPVNFNLNLAAAGDSLEIPAFNKVALPAPVWGADRRIFPSDKGIVYGSFIQRLGFESGGLGQYVRLANLTTGKSVRIEVKPPLRSRKQNTFCCALPPGRYALYKYEFTSSKWYGSETRVESLHKIASPGPSSGLRTTRYLFTVAPGQLHYLVTWNLEQENTLGFLNEKTQLDAHLAPILKNLNFNAAVVALPQ